MKNLVVLFILSAAPAWACPSFDPHARYTEIAVPCTDAGVPDPSQELALNQSDDSTGGECRVPGKYLLEASEVVFVDESVGTTTPIGSVSETPSCYQTDAGGAFYATWIPVTLN